MNNLYIIGGSARTGKTTISKKFRKGKNIIVLPTDKIKDGVRNLLFDEINVFSKNIKFSGSVDFRRRETVDFIHKKFSKKKEINELTWDFLHGFLKSMMKIPNTNMLIEGDAITPKNVHDLQLENTYVKAVFTGYSSLSYGEKILECAKKNPHDWINGWILSEKGNMKMANEMFKGAVKNAKTWKNDCEKFGYKFFDVSKYSSFDKYVDDVVKFLEVK